MSKIRDAAGIAVGIVAGSILVVAYVAFLALCIGGFVGVAAWAFKQVAGG